MHKAHQWVGPKLKSWGRGPGQGLVLALVNYIVQVGFECRKGWRDREGMVVGTGPHKAMLIPCSSSGLLQQKLWNTPYTHAACLWFLLYQQLPTLLRLSCCDHVGKNGNIHNHPHSSLPSLSQMHVCRHISLF